MLNKNAIDKLLEMPDERLIPMIRLLLAGAGMDTSGKKFDEKNVRRIRAVLREVTETDLERIDTLMQKYREG